MALLLQNRRKDLIEVLIERNQAATDGKNKFENQNKSKLIAFLGVWDYQVFDA